MLSVDGPLDPLGRLHEYDTTVSTRFVSDGGQLAAEIANPGGTVTKRFVFGPGADEALVEYQGSGTTDRRFLHADERGSIIATSDNSGNVVSTNSYSEYGVPAISNTGRFGYTGQAWLPEIALSYYKARMYSPGLGRFMQTDPIGYGDGLNWYGYVGADPVNLNDPSGLDVCSSNQFEVRISATPATGSGKPGDIIVSSDHLFRCINKPSSGGGASSTPGGGGRTARPITPLPQIPQSTICVRGTGGYLGGSLEGGVVQDNGDHTEGLGFAAQGQLIGVHLGNGQNAAFSTSGGFYQAGSYQSSPLAKGGVVFGGSIGGSAGFVFTNAQTVSDFSGIANSVNLNIGPIAISYSQNNSAIQTLNIGLSIGYGLSVSSFKTNTVLLGIYNC